MATGQDTAVTRQDVRDRYAAAALRVLDTQPEPPGR